MCIRDRLKALVQKSQGGKFGARDLRRVIRKAVEDPAAERLIDGSLASGGTLVAVSYTHLDVYKRQGMPNAVTALDDVSFTVEEGDFVGIIGATGSGTVSYTHLANANSCPCKR